VTGDVWPEETLLDPDGVAQWLYVDPRWLRVAIERGLPIMGYRTDGVPLVAAGEVRAWLRRPSLADDET
jgi:hypothetical protein